MKYMSTNILWHFSIASVCYIVKCACIIISQLEDKGA